MTSTLYSRRLDAALALAADAFRSTVRKGTSIPYLTHLLQVATWVAEHGGDEDQIIAGLLHDYLEDIPGASAEGLALQFGARVASIVEALTDTTEHPKPPWKPRKEAYLAHLARKPAEVKLVSACDKLHNARSILRDLRVEGPAVWGRFSAPMEETLWYYREVTRCLGDGWQHPLCEELRATVALLHEEAGAAKG